MSNLTWTNQKRKLSDLTPWPRNPRQIDDTQAERLGESWDEFGQVETLAIGPSGEIYNGHQRLAVLADKHGASYEVDVRVSSRPLTEKEREKLTVVLHRGAVGEWDWDLLADFDEGDLLEWGFDEGELQFDDDPIGDVDYSDFDDELDSLDGYQEGDIKISVPAMYREQVIDWLSHGESKTAPGLGKGVMRRCGLL